MTEDTGRDRQDEEKSEEREHRQATAPRDRQIRQPGRDR